MRGKGFRRTCLQICSSDGTAVLPHKSPLVRRSPLFRLTSFLANRLVAPGNRAAGLIVFYATLPCQLPERPDRRLLVSPAARSPPSAAVSQNSLRATSAFLQREEHLLGAVTCSELRVRVWHRGSSVRLAVGRRKTQPLQLRLITWFPWHMKGQSVMKKRKIQHTCCETEEEGANAVSMKY